MGSHLIVNISEDLSLDNENASKDHDEHFICLKNMKNWVQTKVEFYGRTDDAFLLMFLRSCKFDVALTKITLTHYYESRRDIPQWWANKNVFDVNIFPLLQHKLATAVMDGNDHLPTVLLTVASRAGNNLNNLDDYVKLAAIYMESIVRRRNCQKNGITWVIDCRNYKWWTVLGASNPLFAKRFIFSFCQGLPYVLNAIIMLNTPLFAYTGMAIFEKLTPQSIQPKIHCLGSDWSKLGEYVPMEVMPEEYGGQAGSLQQHDDAFINEILSFNDYVVDDNKYGFQSK